MYVIFTSIFVSYIFFLWLIILLLNNSSLIWWFLSRIHPRLVWRSWCLLNFYTCLIKTPFLILFSLNHFVLSLGFTLWFNMRVTLNRRIWSLCLLIWLLFLCLLSLFYSRVCVFSDNLEGLYFCTSGYLYSLVKK